MTKAKSDLGSAKQLVSGSDPHADTAVYHCQQAAEKSLKAFLAFRDAKFEKTHNLTLLIDLCSEIDTEFKKFLESAASLTPYATAFRYPDEFFEPEPTQEEVTQAFNQAEEIYNFVLEKTGD
ncbi:MAG: HEPN domain-containing protein [Deltaproteobacteria bacterium]|nr:HEPN domain-containing protein [Deltaproteobacteria bacterium]